MQRRINTKAVQPRARADPNSSDAGTPAHAEVKCLRARRSAISRDLGTVFQTDGRYRSQTSNFLEE
jgi:hypothetical protein